MSYLDASSAVKNTEIVEILPKRRPTLWCEAKDRVRDVLEVMKKNHLTSVPVYDSTKRYEPMGWVDTRMLCCFLVFGQFKFGPDPERQTVFDECVQFGNTLVGGMLPISPENREQWQYKAYDSVQVLLDPFSKGVHRVLVRFDDHDARRSEVLTQTDLIRWVFHSHAAFRTLLDASLDSLDLSNAAAANKPLISVRSSESALDALRRFTQRDLPAAPVVDAQGVLVANLSASDLRGLGVDDLKAVQKNVMEFLHLYAPQSLQPATCTGASTVRQVIQKMLRVGAHRVWVVTADRKPISVVSMTDIIYQISLLVAKKEYIDQVMTA